MDEPQGIKVKLKDIVDSLEIGYDEFLSFVDLDSGQVATVSRELLRLAEECAEDEDPDLPAWQEREWELARKIVFYRHFKPLPTKFEVNEWAIMEEFSNQVRSDRISEELLDAIHSPGAFRSFNSAIRRNRIEKAWYAFRAGALRQIAIDWCEERHIPCE
jgi:hypothetical protein